MSKIITLTFNPCIDKSATVPKLIPEKKLSCSEPNFEPGGGGINVARVIKKLGGEATAIYPAGGYTGKFFNQLLAKENVPSIVIEIKNPLRENVIVLEEKLKEARQQQVEFLRKEQELKNKEAELELSVQKKLQEEREKLSTEIRKLEEQRISAKETEFQLRLKEME